MKIEQIKELKGMISQAVADDRISQSCAVEIMNKIDAILALPLDVPSDGDVIHESSIRFVSNTGYFNVTKAASFKKGAKWMRGEIINRNK